MSGGRPFDPWSEGFPWREVVEQLFGGEWERPGTKVSGVGVPVDIAETDDAYLVYAVIPGVDPQAIELHVQEDRLLLRGEVREPAIAGQWVSRERRYGRFQRTIPLPGPIDADRAEAKYDAGILVVTLPKATAARVRRIPVRGVS